MFEAAAQLREFVNVIRSDALAAGVELSLSEKSSSQLITSSKGFNDTQLSDTFVDEGDSSGDILGTIELSSAIESVRSVLTWVREFPRARLDLDAQVRFTATLCFMYIYMRKIVLDVTNSCQVQIPTKPLLCSLYIYLSMVVVISYS